MGIDACIINEISNSYKKLQHRDNLGTSERFTPKTMERGLCHPNIAETDWTDTAPAAQSSASLFGLNCGEYSCGRQ